MTMNAKPFMIIENILETAATITASSEDSGFPVENLADRRQFRKFKAAAFGTLTIDIDAGDSVPADSLGIIDHNLGAASADADISVYRSATGAFAGEETEVVAAFTPDDDRAFAKAWESASARYWRVKIVTAATIPYIGVLFLAARLEFPRHIRAPFDPRPDQLNVFNSRSEAGFALGAIARPILQSRNFSMENLTDSFISDSFLPAWDDYISQGVPFFFVWDITNHGDQVYYVTVPGDSRNEIPYNPVLRSINLTLENVKE